MFSKLIFILAMILGLAWAFLDTWIFHGHQSDYALGRDTTATLDGKEFLEGNESLEYDVDGHWVTLRGNVDNADYKAEVGDAVARQLGVRGVTNNLEILNGEALASLRAMLAAPPHNLPFGYEIGRNGVVTLTGAVPDEATRSRIVDMVYSIHGVHNVIDNMTISAPRHIENRIAEILRLHKIYFAFNKADIRPESGYALDAITKVLQEFPDEMVRIEGHTDHIGTDAYNVDLSNRRAKAVRDALVSRGVNAGRMATEGFGESRPAASNDNREGRAENRRIEFRVAG